MDFCELERKGIYRMPSLCARTAVGVLVSGLSPGRLIALLFNGNTPAASNPEMIVCGTIAFDQAAENRK